MHERLAAEKFSPSFLSFQLFVREDTSQFLNQVLPVVHSHVAVPTTISKREPRRTASHFLQIGSTSGFQQDHLDSFPWALKYKLIISMSH